MVLKDLDFLRDLEDKKVAMLQSGGLDSNIVASILDYYGFEIHHIFVNYGQNMCDKEREYAKKIANKYNSKFVEVTIDMPWLEESTVLVNNKVEDFEATGELNSIEYNTYVPLRNHILMSILGGYAESKGISNLACAFDGSEDFYGQPLGGTTDKHPTFVNALEYSLSEGSSLKHKSHKLFNIITPVMDLYKTEIIALGIESNADMKLSWSCYNKGDEPCGECSACNIRSKAFKLSGLEG